MRGVLYSLLLRGKKMTFQRALLACVVGTLLAFYLVFVGSAAMLTPLQLLVFLGLWMLPVLLLAWNTDRI